MNTAFLNSWSCLTYNRTVLIQSWYEENRERLGKRRKEGPKPMRGSEWGELAVLRDPRNEVFG